MVLRKIIEIDEDTCTGCGECIPGCPEGALQIIDGKARLVSDLACDGLGACIGHCPTGAMKVIEREAVPYEEKKVMENIAKAGTNTIIAHLKHLNDHGQTEFLNQAIEYLEENDIEVPDYGNESNSKQVHEEEKNENGDTRMHSHMGEHGHSHGGGGCPGSKMMDFKKSESNNSQADTNGKRPSELQQWPVQFHLISPMAPYFQNADVLLAADCTAFTAGDFHKDFLKDKKLIIACPKLDDSQESYKEKLISLIDDAKINTLTVLIMQVPCCGGLAHMAKEAASEATRKVPIKQIILSIQGEVLSEDWV